MKNYLIDHVDENKRLDFQNKIDVYDLDKELSFFKWDTKGLVLDAGCGNGNSIEKLLARGVTNIHGVDLSEDRVRQARERFLKFENVKIFQRSLDKTEFKDGVYDKVLCRYIYEHVVNPDEIIEELCRILKPNGTINIINFDDIFFNFYTKNATFNQQLKQLKERVPQDFEIGRKLPNILRSHNFEDIKWQGQSYFFQGERLRLERENNRMRLEQGRAHLSKYFSSEAEYDNFAQMYLEEMLDECNVLSTTKFLVSAVKSSGCKLKLIKE